MEEIHQKKIHNRQQKGVDTTYQAQYALTKIILTEGKGFSDRIHIEWGSMWNKR